ncbi:hypothetical protein FB45DRAFT_140863 [Roridomyces roridus]|uniref:t-SNARE coiled-coil homology domain-containing protein n=1 Tax=Roridomyces roridus TaxID=1738132 RepID=A0AAD7BHY4_9AGAR|nr:hypothetical protein FB45DRAFT_140863 [Roridomyces roridus]
MSSSRDRVEDTYEAQNDQRLDELHSKIRTLRGVSPISPTHSCLLTKALQVTTDINNDVERQNLMLDDTGDRFNSFGASLSQSARRAGAAFGIGNGGLKTWRVALFVVGFFLAFLVVRKLFSLWSSSSGPTA